MNLIESINTLKSGLLTQTQIDLKISTQNLLFLLKLFTKFTHKAKRGNLVKDMITIKQKLFCKSILFQ